MRCCFDPLLKPGINVAIFYYKAKLLRAPTDWVFSCTPFLSVFLVSTNFPVVSIVCLDGCYGFDTYTQHTIELTLRAGEEIAAKCEYMR